MSVVRGARARAGAATLPAIAAEDDREADGAGGALQGGLHASGAARPTEARLVAGAHGDGAQHGSRFLATATGTSAARVLFIIFIS